MPALSSRRGFTLVEALLTLGILGVLAGLTIPLVASLPAATSLEASAGALAAQLRRAQARSVAGWDDHAWGVAFFSDQYTVFAGPSYAARIVAEDEVTTLPTAVTLSSDLGAEVLFSSNGVPSADGTLTLTQADGLTAAVDVGPAGAISQP